MAYNYQVIDVAQEIYETELDSPTDTSVGAISYWIRGQVGTINNLLFQSYALNDAGNEISPPINEEEKAIIKCLFMIFRYGRIIRQNLGAAAFNSVIELTSDGGTVRTAQPHLIAQIYVQLKKEEEQNLKTLVNAYRVNRGQPSSVDGSDFIGPLESTWAPYVRVTDKIWKP